MYAFSETLVVIVSAIVSGTFIVGTYIDIYGIIYGSMEVT
jgi:hypothetical protein